MSEPRPYHHGDLRRALVDDAIALIAESGADALSLRLLARRLGVSHAAPYRHFPDKEALLAAVAVDGFHALAARLERVGPGPGWVAGAAEAYVRFALEQPAHFKVMFSVPLSREAHAELGRAGRAAFDALVLGIAREQGEGRARSGDAVSIAIAAWSTAHGLAALLVGGALPAARFGAPEAVLARVLPEIVAAVGPLVRNPV